MHGFQNRQQSFNSPRLKAAPVHKMAINSPRKARDKARHFMKRALRSHWLHRWDAYTYSRAKSSLERFCEQERVPFDQRSSDL